MYVLGHIIMTRVGGVIAVVSAQRQNSRHNGKFLKSSLPLSTSLTLDVVVTAVVKAGGFGVGVSGHTLCDLKLIAVRK
jgi:hypothetical protein